MDTPLATDGVNAGGALDAMPSPLAAWPVSALHTLRELPLDPEFPLFRHYPAMKLGVRESIREYGRLLMPLARDVIARRPESTDWMVTGPPFFVVPSGANLMAWEVYRLLARELPSYLSLRAVDVHLLLPPFSPVREDYSKSGVKARIENRRRLQGGDQGLKLDPAVFRGRAVLFINDINVTGTQQSFMQQAFEAVGPTSVDWLYVIQVDLSLGRSKPELEYALNHLSLGTFEAFEELVRRADIDFTGACIRRLFAYPTDRLEPLFRALDDTRRRRLYALATREGIYTRADDLAKLALLRKGFASFARASTHGARQQSPDASAPLPPR